MENALSFLSEHKDVAFATVEGDKPKIRVFQIMKRNEDILYFATATHKEVYQQLQKNPFVELLAMAGNISVRVKGKALFDVSNNIGKEIYETNPVLIRLYHSYSELVYFRLAISELENERIIATEIFPIIVGIFAT